MNWMESLEFHYNPAEFGPKRRRNNRTEVFLLQAINCPRVKKFQLLKVWTGSWVVEQKFKKAQKHLHLTTKCLTFSRAFISHFLLRAMPYMGRLLAPLTTTATTKTVTHFLKVLKKVK